MKAILVENKGRAPVYGDFAEPHAGPGEYRIRVTAAALSPLTRARAAGSHYSAAASYPFVTGADGVGRLEDGRRVYFVLPRPPFGAMAEWSVAAATHCIPLPDGINDVTAAAMANPGMSSWAAFVERAHLKPGETVLINGATGISGLLAIQIARHLGAKRIVATGRSPDGLAAAMAAGADQTILLSEPGLEDRFREACTQGIDVVIDYLWGASAQSLLTAAAKEETPVRFVQAGASSGVDITLPGAVLRASAITLMGSGIGSVPLERLAMAVAAVFQAAVPGKFAIATKAVPLPHAPDVWQDDNSRQRTVFTL